MKLQKEQESNSEKARSLIQSLNEYTQDWKKLNNIIEKEAKENLGNLDNLDKIVVDLLRYLEGHALKSFKVVEDHLSLIAISPCPPSNEKKYKQECDTLESMEKYLENVEKSLKQVKDIAKLKGYYDD